MSLLEAYPWPGQMEELLRAVKHAAESAGNPMIQGHDLPESIRVWGHVHSRRPTALTPIMLDHFLEEIQRELIARTLARTRNNRSKAAELLGVSERTAKRSWAYARAWLYHRIQNKKSFEPISKP